MKHRGTEQDDGTDRGFTLNPRVNGVFIAILCGEIRMTLAGMNWPADGGRVVVGRAI